MKKPRFSKVLRGYARRDGTCDRYWIVTDRDQRGFQVLKVSTFYPGAELVAGAYALKLNARDRAAKKAGGWKALEEDK
jgi:hypothetical protein